MKLSSVLSMFAVLLLSIGALSVSVVLSQTVLYSQSFTSEPNGYVPPNWYTPGSASFKTQNGLFASTGNNGYTVAYYTGASYSDFEFQALATGLSGCGQSPPVLGLTFRMQNYLNGYVFWGDIDKLQIVKLFKGSFTPLDYDGIGQINPTGTFNMTVVVQGSTLTAIWNSKYTISVQDSTFASGYIGVMTYNCNAGYNNLVVTGVGGTTTSVSSSTSSSSSSSTSSSTSSTSSSSTSSTSTTSSTTISGLASVYSSSNEVCDQVNTCSITVSIPSNALVLLFPATGVKVTSGFCSDIPTPPVISSVQSSLTWTQRGTSVDSVCQDVVGYSGNPETPFQIYGGEEWYATSSSAISDTVTVNVPPTTVPNEISLYVVVIKNYNPSGVFLLGSPCIATGLSQVASCNITTNSGLIIANDESLNGVCAGPNFSSLAGSSAYIQDIGGESESNLYQQSNYAVIFNHNCVDNNINQGTTIWVMTTDVIG